jgi:hypothetical protein
MGQPILAAKCGFSVGGGAVFLQTYALRLLWKVLPPQAQVAQELFWQQIISHVDICGIHRRDSNLAPIAWIIPFLGICQK